MTDDVKPDFSGYATKSDLQCADGRTILRGAFAHQNGERVPLVWGHGHDRATNVLGHVLLENVEDGVRAHAFFNNTVDGQHAKEMVKHGDVRWLSIFANQLKEKAKQVSHGFIREVSLVLAGANPGATIDNRPAEEFAHGDDGEYYYDEADITTGLEIEVPEMALAHAAGSGTATKKETDSNSGSGKSLEEILGTLNEEQSNAVDYLLSQALTHSEQSAEADSDAEDEGDADAGEAEGENTEGAAGAEGEGSEGNAEGENAEGTDNAEGSEGDGNGTEGTEGTDNAEGAEGDGNAAESVQSTDNAEGTEGTEGAEGTEGGNAEGNTAAGDSVQHDNNSQEDNSMTHNVFDRYSATGAAGATGPTAAHTQVKLGEDVIKGIIEHADEVGSLKKAFKAFMRDTGVTVDGELKHGIENIDYLFPDAKLLDNSPQFLSRRMEWVDKVLSGVRKQPYGRIKSVSADITMEEARAKGYIKGNMKKEEFFKLSKRETTPQTVYKKQALDRDDVIDIVDLDVIAWMKAEMKVMLDEAIAEAILFGDGRSNGDEDKIREDKIRPIATDDELYATTVNVNLDDSNSSIEEFVDVVIDNRQYYKGTGSPTFFTTEATVSKFLKQKDGFGRRIYDDITDIQKVLRVSEIVTVESMERVPDLVGIMVNLVDYTIGTDRLGAATMFDDFDIDYNKLKYLIETRLSGALAKLKSALVFRSVPAASVLREPLAPDFDGTTVTVPTVTGVVYKDGQGNTLTTASPVALDPGEQLHVVATPEAGSYFENNAEDEWDFVGEEA